MKNKTTRISQAFQRWLLALVVIAFLATTVFLWLIQTGLAEDNAINLLALNIADVRKDIQDASDDNLLALTEEIAGKLNHAEEITVDFLFELCHQYDVTEINCIDPDGFIFASTYPDFINYDMRSGEQSAEFLPLLSGEQSYVQKYQPVSYDASISRKYAGVVLENGGFEQMMARETAISITMAITVACLVFMFFSRKTVYPWLISLMSLLLPLLLIVTNTFPA